MLARVRSLMPLLRTHCVRRTRALSERPISSALLKVKSACAVRAQAPARGSIVYISKARARGFDCRARVRPPSGCISPSSHRPDIQLVGTDAFLSGELVDEVAH